MQAGCPFMNYKHVLLVGGLFFALSVQAADSSDKELVQKSINNQQAALMPKRATLDSLYEKINKADGYAQPLRQEYLQTKAVAPQENASLDQLIDYDVALLIEGTNIDVYIKEASKKLQGLLERKNGIYKS
jgi:hypothetical protein